jgi:hypothetical protein
VDQSDLDRIAATFARRTGIEPGTDRYQVVTGRYAGFWGVFAAMDSDGDGRVTLDEWFRGMDALTSSEEQYDRVIGQMVDQLFDLLDADRDGRVSYEEFSLWLDATNVDPTSAREAFPRLDLDGDGILSKDEVTYLMLDFFYSSDPEAPGNWLFGTDA